ncbi:MAG: carbohydrate ABC transporter permease [Firmicutes bacterium]|nr:carbohydrate ABC transporter permease [Bacillota bacterium]
MNKKRPSEILFDGFNVCFLVLFSVICFYPMYYVAVASLSNSSMFLAHRGLLLKPLGFSTNAYSMVFRNPMIVQGYLNTGFIIIVGVTLNLLMTALGAYVLSRNGVLLKNLIMKIIIFTMFFSGGLIPTYLLVRGIGLYNKIWALILPNAISTFNLIIMRTGFMAIPISLDESARIDGANDYRILFRIILPLSMPVIAVLLLYYSVAHWNSWFSAMIYLRERSLYPIQLILREILIANSTEAMLGDSSDVAQIGETVKYATIIVTTLPILFVYPFLQRHFIKGIMIGALKG